MRMIPQSQQIQRADVRIQVEGRDYVLTNGVVDLESILQIAAAPIDSFVLRVDGGIARTFEPECKILAENLSGARFRLFPGGAAFPFVLNDQNWTWGSDTVTVDDILSVTGREFALALEGVKCPLDIRKPIDLAAVSPPRFWTIPRLGGLSLNNRDTR